MANGALQRVLIVLIVLSVSYLRVDGAAAAGESGGGPVERPTEPSTRRQRFPTRCAVLMRSTRRMHTLLPLAAAALCDRDATNFDAETLTLEQDLPMTSPKPLFCTPSDNRAAVGVAPATTTTMPTAEQQQQRGGSGSSSSSSADLLGPSAASVRRQRLRRLKQDAQPPPPALPPPPPPLPPPPPPVDPNAPQLPPPPPVPPPPPGAQDLLCFCLSDETEGQNQARGCYYGSALFLLKPPAPFWAP